MNFQMRGSERHLTARCAGFSAEVSLRTESPYSVSVCMPFREQREFYFNEKINLLRADCRVTLDGVRYDFDPGRTFSLLDWGRGVWPFSHEWYWSSASVLLGGEPFGFNLGCGFGSDALARGTENIVYHKGEPIKLGRVIIRHGADVMAPWILEEEQGRFKAVLTPRCERDSVTKLLFVNNRCYQMFGTFSGSFTGADGRAVSFDRVAGFAATETFKNIQRGRHVERRCFFVVERTIRLEISACSF